MYNRHVQQREDIKEKTEPQPRDDEQRQTSPAKCLSGLFLSLLLSSLLLYQFFLVLLLAQGSFLPLHASIRFAKRFSARVRGPSWDGLGAVYGLSWSTLGSSWGGLAAAMVSPYSPGGLETNPRRNLNPPKMQLKKRLKALKAYAQYDFGQPTCQALLIQKRPKATQGDPKMT